MPTMKFSLLRYFTVTSSVAFLIIAALILYLHDRSQTDQIVTSIEHQNVFLATLAANQLGGQINHDDPDLDAFDGDADFSPGSPFHRLVSGAIAANLKSVPVLKVMIFRGKETIYSSDMRQIGQSKDKPAILEAMNRNRPVSKLTFRERFDSRSGLVEDRYVVETYVPTDVHGIIVQDTYGAEEPVYFELYTDVTPLIGELQAERYRLMVMLFLAFGFLYAVLLIIVKRADSTIRQQQDNLENRAAELLSMTEALASTRDDLQKSNDQKDRFFSVIAHDLKSPFNALLGFSQLLSEQAGQLEREKVSEYGRMVHQAAEAAYKLLEDLLDWSRLNMDRIEFNPEDFNLCELLQQNQTRFAPMAAFKDITLDLSPPEETPVRVHADINMVDAILRNLISNAVKFTPPSGRIALSCQNEGTMIKVKVSDNGVGIPADRSGTLFHLGCPTTSGTQGETGTGLGLQLCRELARKQGGELDFLSEEGKGSTFGFTLPRA